ncbi:MAG: hypothetical protein HUM72_12480 [Dolichospermum sp.]|nr:hypothetical protein [Dolichospermum sp.]
MKSFIAPTYTFTPGASGVGTVNLSGISGFNIKYLVSIINQTSGVIIYSTASSSLRYTSVSGTTITLFRDTSVMSGSDVLQVVYDDPQLILPPDQGTPSQSVRIAPQSKYRSTFAAAISNNVDTSYFTLLQTGSGMTVNQTAGNLVITSGITANAETVIRSTQSYKDAIAARWTAILSQRIANQNFFVELVDVIGDNLAYTINSATSVTVTIPGTTYTAANVGQSATMQLITGAAGVPGRYAIASVVGTAVTFTVAGWPATGTGTLSLVGMNSMRTTYSGTTATAATVETQRRGYNTNSSFSATINTTASPGHMAEMTQEDGSFAFSDSLQAVASSLPLTTRAESIQSLPDQASNLFLQIRVLNGSTAPASTTTLTMGMVQVTNWASQKVVIAGISGMSKGSSLPVAISGGTLGTVTTVSTVSAVTSANLAIPGTIADVASAALTTTTTTAALTPTFGIAYQVNIPVIVVSGTLDVTIEESDDSGTNWYRVYDFPRITATGIYRSPHIPFLGNRVRYVQTVGGTTPSFTRAINRLQSNYPALPQRQLIDRTISLTTLNSTTPILLARDCGNATQLIISVGTITTTAPALQLEGSDDFGNTWYSIGSQLTAVANSTVQTTVTDINAAALRARVSTAGVGVTANYVMIKAHD